MLFTKCLTISSLALLRTMPTISLPLTQLASFVNYPTNASIRALTLDLHTKLTINLLRSLWTNFRDNITPYEKTVGKPLIARWCEWSVFNSTLLVIRCIPDLKNTLFRWDSITNTPTYRQLHTIRAVVVDTINVMKRWYQTLSKAIPLTRLHPLCPSSASYG